MLTIWYRSNTMYMPTALSSGLRPDEHQFSAGKLSKPPITIRLCTFSDPYNRFTIRGFQRPLDGRLLIRISKTSDVFPPLFENQPQRLNGGSYTRRTWNLHTLAHRTIGHEQKATGPLESYATAQQKWESTAEP